MKKILVVLLVIVIQLAIFGCTNIDELPQETASNNVLNIPTKQPSFTENHKSLLVTPTLTNIIEKEEEFSLSISFDYGSIFISPLEILQSYFTGEAVVCHNQMNITKHNNEYYYVDGAPVYMINSDGESKKIKIDFKNLPDNLSGETYLDIMGISSIHDKLYTYVERWNDDHSYFYMIDLESKELMNGYTGIPKAQFGNKVIVYLYNNNNYNSKYGIYDLTNQKTIGIKSLDKYTSDYYLDNIAWANDNCFIATLYNRDDAFDENTNGKFVIIDINTYMEVGVIEFNEIEATNPEIFLVEDEIISLFGDESNCIKTYNIKTGELKNSVQFFEKCKFIKYDRLENSLYLQMYDYNHLTTNLHGYDYHLDTNLCITSEELENSYLAYVKFELTNQELDILNTIPIKEYISGANFSYETCIRTMKDFKIGDYIFTYYNSGEAPYFFYNMFASKFKLGEDIDFDIWKE